MDDSERRDVGGHDAASGASLLPPAVKSADFEAYMKRLYEQEMESMLENLINHLPHDLAQKVRKALAAKQRRLKLKRRQAYINRRRKLEVIRTDELNVLKDFYEGRKFVPGEVMTDSSSSGDEKVDEAANKGEMDTMLGELANMNPEEMAAMLEERVAAEAAEIAEREAAEARRLER
jgi:hypothetical protein